MDRNTDYRGLRFDGRQRVRAPRRFRRPIAVILAMAIYALLWPILSMAFGHFSIVRYCRSKKKETLKGAEYQLTQSLRQF